MAETDVTFSEYANAFYKIIEGEKSKRAEFVKMLLKMGLSANGKKIVDEMFPIETTSKGNTIIEKKASDRLRKYLLGTNDISEIADEIYAALDHDSYNIYIKELKDYDCFKLIEFAKELKLDTDIDNINKVRHDIAACYYAIIEKSLSQKYPDKNKPKDSNDIILSYTLAGPEKHVLLNQCRLAKNLLTLLTQYIDKIFKKQQELKALHNSSSQDKYKIYLECELDSLKKQFDESYHELEIMCADIVKLLESKKSIHSSFDSISSFAKDISNNKYKITCADKFDYAAFSLMVSKFNDSYNRLLRDIDKI